MYFTKYPEMTIVSLEQRLERVNTYSSLIIWCSYYTHLLDQYRYELIEWAEALREGKALISTLFAQYGGKDAVCEYELKKEQDVLNELTDMLKYAMVMVLLVF